MSTIPPTTFWGSAKAFFEDPNVIQMLGGIGSQMGGPGSAGQILGDAAVRGSRNKAAQDLAAKQLAGGELERRELREMNRKLLERLGPLTPSGTEGLNSAKETKTGALELDVDTGDPYKLAADLGDFTAEGSPGVTSMRRSPTGSYIFNVDAPPIVAEPTTIADQVDDFAPSSLYTNSKQQRLSYAPVNPEERMAEMADLMSVNMPPQMTAAMRSPTVPSIQRVSSPAQQQAQLQSDVDELTGQPQPRRGLRQRY
jgi:hypothetical protein